VRRHLGERRALVGERAFASAARASSSAAASRGRLRLLRGAATRRASSAAAAIHWSPNASRRGALHGFDVLRDLCSQRGATAPPPPRVGEAAHFVPASSHLAGGLDAASRCAT